MNVKERFGEIYLENYSQVISLCLGYVSGDEDLAKELAQIVFIKVWEHLQSFRNQSQISTWIYRIAVNTCLQELRRRRFVPVSSDTPVEPTDDPQQKEQRFRAMYDCIDKLSQENKTIILLELQNVPQNEIADILGLSHAATRTRVHRIKEQLSNCVQHERL